MYCDQKIWMANSDSGERLYLLPKMANRHGLIAGATGTGKTITMKVMAESFSDMGVPVFFSDVKGDLSGMLCPGNDTADMQARILRFGIENFRFQGYPTRFWDIFGEAGTPARVTVSSMGPTLLARLFNLTEAQTGVLNIVFRVADDNGLLLDDLKDLRAMVQYVGENRAEFTNMYGNVSSASIGGIQRALLAFEDEGGEALFGKPELDIRDWMRTDYDGRGYINILSSKRLISSPNVYGTFLLWLLTSLFEKLPEVGDLEKPRMVFFFDEAHLLFDGAPKALIQKITQVVKLIRSKGVGVYFVTQAPTDIPDSVLSQLSNRIQHGLRAYTVAEQAKVKAAARAFRDNSGFDEEKALQALGTGEALVSFLDAKGIPAVVEIAKILPPQSRMGAADEAEVTASINSCEFDMKYREVDDRESAYEVILAAREQLIQEQEELAAALAAEKQAAKEAAAAEKAAAAAEKAAAKEAAAAEKQAAKEAAAAEKAAAKKAADKKKVAQKAVTSATSSVSTAVTRNLVNSLTGGKVTSTGTIAKRAATNALSSVVRSGTTSIVRGLFGNKK